MPATKRYPTRGMGSPKFDKARQRAIASLGGITAHQMGVAHEYTVAEAVKYGRIGGRASAAKRKAQEAR